MSIVPRTNTLIKGGYPDFNEEAAEQFENTGHRSDTHLPRTTADTDILDSPTPVSAQRSHVRDGLYPAIPHHTMLLARRHVRPRGTHLA